MAIIEINNVSFQYPDEPVKALNDVTLSMEEAEFIVVAGPSGCGKTTLLKLLKSELTPVGNREGTVIFYGQQLDLIEGNCRLTDVGYVFQNPENQIVMDEVLSELVFGLENQGFGTKEMRQRVAEMVQFFGLESLLHAETHTLSGGQKQLINLASVLLLKPKLLLLDEPTSQLDPVQAKEFLQFLRRLNEEFGMTIILVEHRLEDVFSLADRIIVMNEGSTLYDGSPKEVIHQILLEKDHRFISYLPSVSRLYDYFQTENYHWSDIPTTVKETHRWLHNLEHIAKVQIKNTSSNVEEKAALLEVSNIYYKYTKESPFVLKNLSLTVREGDFLAIVGGNGSGKSTLLKCCTNIAKPLKGSIKLNNKKMKSYKQEALAKAVGYLPQNPLLCFMGETLEEELTNIALRFDIPNPKERITMLTEQLGITSILQRHIHDCSGGEQQKAALATILIHQPTLLVIDEPTKGMDPVSKQQFAQLLKSLHGKGKTILMVTHDIEFAAEHAERCAWLFDGSITTEGSMEEVLPGNYFYTTTINRVTRKIGVPEVLTLEEAVSAWNIPVQS